MTWEQFEGQLDNPVMEAYFKSIDLSVTEARRGLNCALSVVKQQSSREKADPKETYRGRDACHSAERWNISKSEGRGTSVAAFANSICCGTFIINAVDR